MKVDKRGRVQGSGIVPMSVRFWEIEGLSDELGGFASLLAGIKCYRKLVSYDALNPEPFLLCSTKSFFS